VKAWSRSRPRWAWTGFACWSDVDAPSVVVALLGFSCDTRKPGAAAPGMVVVAISSVEGGRPEAGSSDREIHHLVSAASQEDIVAGEKRANWRMMATFCVGTLMKALLSNDCRPTRAAPRGNLARI
jgi:hypothetical protein